MELVDVEQRWKKEKTEDEMEAPFMWFKAAR